MIIPVRCFNCGQILASKYKIYNQYLNASLLIEQKNSTSVYYVPASVLKAQGKTWDKKDERRITDRHSQLNSVLSLVEINSKNDKLGEDTKFKANNIEALLLDQLGLKRYCCRSHMVSHIQLLDKL